MRLWSLHPKYLDRRGLVALWREGLLAQAVLRGKTIGYVHHPQLDRFREQPASVGLVAEYLRVVRAEAASRGYRFAARRISRSKPRTRPRVTRGQLQFEWRHLLKKVAARDREWAAALASVKRPRAHPLFRVVPGKASE